ncbi:MAG: rRNA maturation RNase YbeY [Patescibacteria group bacterium]
MITFEVLTPLPKPLKKTDLVQLPACLKRARGLKQDRVISVRFVSSADIRQLNKTYRGLDRPTDVLSFGAEPVPGLRSSNKQAWLGDLAICVSYAATEAKRRSIDVREELIRLLVHGALHLAGYDHATPEEEQNMFVLQEQCVSCMMNRV